MRTGHLLFSGVHFFMISLLLGMGVLFLVLPYAPLFRMQLIAFIENPAGMCQWIGGIVLGIGMILFAAAFLLSRKQYVRIEMNGTSFDVDEKVIRRCTLSYFRERFPEFEPLSDVVVKGKSTIEVFTSLPAPQEEEFFEEVEEELSALLARRLGYQKPFTVTFVES
ncbi:MAG: hypothetical protein KDK64_08155 [Chlamydiia bacterium]|nr:hypothetical protein [Chlamydiia bacterium]